MTERVFHPIISSIQKIHLYETKEKLILVGSNDKETRFKTLEIDRTVPDELKFYEDLEERNAKWIRNYVRSLNFSKGISAYGILGFIRFLEGYYLILVTKRTRRAVVGMHMIYTIKDTVMIKVHDSSQSKQSHSHEQRYLKMFSNIDLSSNFYFSYSYDLTRSLQYNMSPPAYLGTTMNDAAINWDDKSGAGGDGHKAFAARPREKREFAFRGNSRKRFVWNSFLLQPLDSIMLKDWVLEIIHGFVGQSNISIFGRPIYVCLIARRSTKFAGTRFLKRGANFSGDVANEVETEQIVVDGNRMCSFVQMRGSIPSHWSQDISKMVPKPPISLDLADPFSETSGKHFQRLIFHHGAPLIVLNLVKKREKRKHESILTEEMLKDVRHLNQFLPPQFRIKYYHFDMARKSRGGGNVMEGLATNAENILQMTNFYFHDANVRCYQTGIVRVNCVDCLDRTNTAQFAIGKCALSHQLCKMGFIKPAKLEFDSDCVTMLESLYEDHGDTLALQYGGSQLVHRIKTYRKTAAWTSQGNDIMQTLSRYYSNTFSDTEKQHSINLFLGYYIPHENILKSNGAIWELPTDYYMHNTQTIVQIDEVPITQWVSSTIMKHLPQSTSCQNKIVRELIEIKSNDYEMTDSYSNYYLPYRLTLFEDNIAYQISLLARNYMPTFRTNFSPFEPGRRREERGNNKNPSLTGQSSTSSATSSTSSSSVSEESSSDDEQLDNEKSDQLNVSLNENKSSISFEAILPSMSEIYGQSIVAPTEDNIEIYRKYTEIDRNSKIIYKLNLKNFLVHEKYRGNTEPLGDYNENFARINRINEESVKIYGNYCNAVGKIFDDNLKTGNSDSKTNECILNYFKLK